MLIVTAGMIGVGKTTLTKLIAENYGTQPFYEPVGDNPVLPLFYNDPKRYAFLLQIFFLNRRFDMIKRALDDDNNVLDRSIYEDALFTKVNFENGGITKQEYDVYTELLANMMEELKYAPKKRPDLLVYSEADFDTILYRIKKRGRDYEQYEGNDELITYYHNLWSAYKTWFEEYDVSPKIKINLQELDLQEKANQIKVLDLIDEKLKEVR